MPFPLDISLCYVLALYLIVLIGCYKYLMILLWCRWEDLQEAKASVWEGASWRWAEAGWGVRSAGQAWAVACAVRPEPHPKCCQGAPHPRWEEPPPYLWGRSAPPPHEPLWSSQWGTEQAWLRACPHCWELPPAPSPDHRLQEWHGQVNPSCSCSYQTAPHQVSYPYSPFSCMHVEIYRATS